MNSSKTVFFAIGVLLVILGAFMLIPFFVQFIYDEKNNAFLLSATVTAFIGTLFVLTNLEVNRKLNLQQVFLLTTLSWLSIAVFGDRDGPRMGFFISFFGIKESIELINKHIK